MSCITLLYILILFTVFGSRCPNKLEQTSDSQQYIKNTNFDYGTLAALLKYKVTPAAQVSNVSKERGIAGRLSLSQVVGLKLLKSMASDQAPDLSNPELEFLRNFQLEVKFKEDIKPVQTKTEALHLSHISSAHSLWSQ